ncbi:hypothetical protein [Nocardia altamirensis]|uniref:hypothetical protein n=1 Tax=Nocardia altamirensis TaxID=472158 RepID=UPI0008402742|nr:hypothetical protein [Nocardia altamirensis]
MATTSGKRQRATVKSRTRRKTEIGPRIGDFIESGTGSADRIATVLRDGRIMLAHPGSSFHYNPATSAMGHSGGLARPLELTLTDTGERRDSDAWQFSPEMTRQHITVPVRVWRSTSA